MHPDIETRRNREPQRWPGLLPEAQRDLADRIERAADAPGFGTRAYRDWLGGQAGVCVLCADAIDELGRWHAGDPALRGTAQAWAVELREWARLAAADLRVLGEEASPSSLLEEWCVFLAGACGSQRAGEALGAIALHSRVLPGRADAALAALLALPFVRPAAQYVARRRQAEPQGVRVARDRLLDAYATAALAAGALRAAAWTLDAIDIVQTQSRG